MDVIGNIVKKVLYRIYTFVFIFYYRFKDKSFQSENCILFNIKLKGIKKNNINIEGQCDNTNIEITGNWNHIKSKGIIHKTKFQIFGENNSIIIEEGVKLRNSHIIIRGNNCQILIGKYTTIGSMYMVNMGVNNKITIGKNCMLSDNIDIWSSDSHPIYDDKSNIINISKPIIIEDHVWLGKDVKILKGTTIEKNSIIGMGSIVSGKHIENNTLNVGTPCKTIKRNINWNNKFIEL